MCCGTPNLKPITPNQAANKTVKPEEISVTVSRQFSDPQSIRQTLQKDFIVRQKNGGPHR